MFRWLRNMSERAIELAGARRHQRDDERAVLLRRALDLDPADDLLPPRLHPEHHLRFARGGVHRAAEQEDPGGGIAQLAQPRGERVAGALQQVAIERVPDAKREVALEPVAVARFRSSPEDVEPGEPDRLALR